jgi:hypothetical protein
MTDGCGCVGKPQKQEKSFDLDEEVTKGKRERQAVLQRVRQQRARVVKRLAAKIKRISV